MSNIARTSVELVVEPSSDPAMPTPFRTYPIRYFGLVMIALLNIVSSINWLSFSPAPQFAATYFSTDLTAVNMLSTAFPLSFLVTSWLSGWMIARFGTKTGLLTGAIGQAFGSWVKYFATFSTSPATKYRAVMFGQVCVILVAFCFTNQITFVGIRHGLWRSRINTIRLYIFLLRCWQILCGLAQPFILNAPTMYAAIWFTENGRATANMVGSISNPLGVAVADLIIPALVPDVSSYTFGILIVAIITTVVTTPVFFIPAHPPTPPSYSASTEHEPFFPGLMKLACNVHFLILLLTFSIGVGLFSAFSTLLNQIVVPYGYSDDDAGIFGAIMVVAGLIGAGLAGPFVDRTKQHKLFAKIIMPVMAIVYIVFIFVVGGNNYAAIAVMSALIGLTSFSLLPVALELGVESTYPISESTSSSILWGAGELFTVIFLVINDGLRQPDGVGSPPRNMRNALIFDGVLCALAGVVIMFYRSRNLRMDVEQSQRGKDEQGNADSNDTELTEVY
ncbi:major facilitator superfamily domain-containing protein [Jimgerdemannia flammicorona]|uniref:Major facilitator superfamily domain-containing protein n=1 Tax=Jimgerdemannia flammicorona TaxID=994334 RepID=A0A433QRH6_9FUNG|nr:major facilitator superfamily domain-containing protein [Jimgerdemannia flammicorona]